jgi:DNA-binding response OmpR family regulator
MKNVLIIEDDKFILNTVVKKFENSEFSVDFARDIDEAVSFLEKKIPDIILLDIILPKGNGLELLKKIKGDSRTASIPVIVFSNLSSDENIKTAKEYGAVQYIIKANVSPLEVVNKVKEILSI